MAPLPSRKSLEAMKRADLQRICKDYGVRANLKSEALIDLLLDTQSAPAPQPTRRSASTRIPSKAGPSRVSSMIVHDIDEEEEHGANSNTHEVDSGSMPTPQPPPRTRKAKDTQVRLGVGKPRTIGGDGARAITRSSGSSKSKWTKPSRSMIPKEDTIVEEPEAISGLSSVTEPATQAVPSLPLPPQGVSSSNSHDDESLSLKRIVVDALRPLQEEILFLKSKLTEVETIKADLLNLRTQVNEINKLQSEVRVEFQSLQGLPAVVVSLKEELHRLREGLQADRTPPQPSTPKSRPTQLHQAPVGFGMPSKFPDVGGSPSRPPDIFKAKASNPPPHPGIAGSTLGKRHRDSIDSDITGVVEEGQEEGFSDGELTKTVLRPTKKKPKIDNEDTGHVRGSSRPASANSIADQRETIPNEDAQTFTVFRSDGDGDASDYLDPPPPTNRLPDFFEPIGSMGLNINPPRPRSTISTSSALASENQPQTFGFGFLPISSTPQNPMYMPPFPFPEESPSPAGTSMAGYVGRIDDPRIDMFKSFGFSSPIKSARHYGALTQDGRGVNPAALTQGSSTRQRESPSNDAQPAPSSESATNPLPNKRTMYGTELEGDTRFGDFGLEGMATDYWASGKF